MSGTSDELAYERVINRNYLKCIENKPVYRIAGTPPKLRNWGPLTGRVSFIQGQPDDDAEFYIGPQQAMWEGVEVVSWAAPAAQAFFSSDRRWNGQYIRVRRRFNSKQDSIVGYADEWVMRKDKTAFPQPQRRRALARPNGATVERAVAAQRGAERPDPADRVAPTNTELQAAHLPEPEQDNSTRQQYLREAMRAPRRGTLGAVLSTLQPEQYDLVTADPRESLTVQGFAGTGKSIIATHRAAWLTHPDREGPKINDLLLVGPSNAWADHMEPAIRELSAGDAWVETRALGELIMDLLDLPPDYGDVVTPWDVGPVVTKFATRCVREVLADPRKKGDTGTVYTALRSMKLKAKPGASAETRQGLDSLAKWQWLLPTTYEEALTRPQLLPLLAYITACLRPADGYGHVIVDEAQDLRYLEWRLLARLNRGTFTILGDVSQCRSADGITDWARVPRILGRDPWPTAKLTAGYRSSQSIIDFASALLPASVERRSESILGAGAPPRVLNAKEAINTMEVLALEEARRLSAKYHQGSVALICADPTPVVRVAKQRRWTRQDNVTWRHPVGNRVCILEADDCRGLEFDATVVVEPAAFNRLGRNYGELYTVLTRANRELVVVHDKPLPAALARAAEATIRR